MTCCFWRAGARCAAFLPGLITFPCLGSSRSGESFQVQGAVSGSGVCGAGAGAVVAFPFAGDPGEDLADGRGLFQGELLALVPGATVAWNSRTSGLPPWGAGMESEPSLMTPAVSASGPAGVLSAAVAFPSLGMRVQYPGSVQRMHRRVLSVLH